MAPSFDTCVYCIVLVDGGPETVPHQELRRRAGTSVYDCSACGSRWSCDLAGWRREGAAAKTHRSV